MPTKRGRGSIGLEGVGSISKRQSRKQERPPQCQFVDYREDVKRLFDRKGEKGKKRVAPKINWGRGRRGSKAGDVGRGTGFL